MRRVWFLIVLVLLAGAALACSVLLWWPRPVEFTKDLDGRIRPGMTEADVVAVLGRPAGNYARGVPSPAGAAPGVTGN
jgi:outer membrane protein assembly factor BamE (lipoprotein component of BamABCDE complex)